MSFKKIAAYKDRNKKTPLPYSGTKVFFMYSHGLNITVLFEHLPTLELK